MAAEFAARIRAGTNPNSSNAQGRRRDAWIVKLCNIGPVSVNDLVRLGIFRKRQGAQRRMDILEAAGKVKCVGRCSVTGFKREILWCNRKFWDRMLEHERRGMLFFFALWPHAYAVAGRDCDQQWRADMEVTTDKKRMVEIDMDTEPLHQVKKRLKVYDSCPHSVLFICPTESRLQEVNKLTVNPLVYFSTFDRAVGDPWGTHWTNCLKETAGVAKPGANAGSIQA